jgi:imidazolonepropionase-like amidohydrolase
VKTLIFLFSLVFSFIVQGEGLLLKGGNVHTADSQGILENTDIYIKDGKIIKIGKDLKVSASRIEDLNGKIVTPGFIAPYSQLGIVEIEAVAETRDDRSTVYSSGLSIVSAFNPHSTLIPYNLRGGITTALSVPSSSGLYSGLASSFSLSSSLEGSLISQDIALFGSVSSGEDSRAAKMLLLEDSLDVASRIVEADGWNDEKGLPSSSSYSSRDIIALKRVLSREIPLVVRADRASDILFLINFSIDKNIRLIVRGGSEAWMVAKQLAETNTPVILEPINNLPGSFNQLGARLDNASMLNKSGVKILIASHETHNSYLSRQAAGIAVSYGLPWDMALRAITSNVAEVFGLKKIGMIKTGYKADLIIWDKDPLEISAFAQQIYISGRLMSSESRSTRLRDRYLNSD